jgi:uncharacterized secreted protein with C-terminal beta-propeller domain
MRNRKMAILTPLVIISMISLLVWEEPYCSGRLDRFGSFDRLVEFLQRKPSGTSPPAFGVPGPSLLLDPSIFKSGFDYSRTNVQVEGVDEADIVKTDGEFIYLISHGNVIIIRGYPAENTAILSNVTVNGTLRQIFVNQERLVIFYENGSYEETCTFAGVYDISDREKPFLRREFGASGSYFSSRMIGDYVYVVIRKSACSHGKVDLPKTLLKAEIREVPATDIYYSDTVDWGYMFTTVAALNVLEDSQEPNFKTVLTGYTANLYVSMENVYLGVSDGDTTFLYRIHIESGEITHAATGRVSGQVMNQFSMDEFDGYFRVATTSLIGAEFWNTGRMLHTQNNLYVLNMEMKVVGRIEEIAPGENIHSARFMGKKCYLVTFKKIDPFFVIDLSDPQSPAVLGELKVSGYSDCLHPYDENHVIGVGKDTVEGEGGNFAWYQGVKISLFDVADVNHPEELAKYVIGDRGSDTPVLTDHKAFLFDKERNLLVLPVSVAEVNRTSPYSNHSDACGELVYQGAYVFTVSLDHEGEIVLKGNVTHVENGELRDSSNRVTRSLYIENVLYTFSENKIKMNSLLDLSEIKELKLN